MNSNKRGYVIGFKLESLKKVGVSLLAYSIKFYHPFLIKTNILFNWIHSIIITISFKNK